MKCIHEYANEKIEGWIFGERKGGERREKGREGGREERLGGERGKEIERREGKRMRERREKEGFTTLHN